MINEQMTKDTIINRIWDRIDEDYSNGCNQFGTYTGDEKTKEVLEGVRDDLHNTLNS